MSTTDMQQVKPIETLYKGCRFRSRLEARWAVFFDATGLAWHYEPEGYVLGELGWYFPDFWLPDLGIWYEVKGDVPTQHEIDKAHALGEATDARIYIAFGQIPYWGVRVNSFSYDEVESAYLCWPHWDNCHWWCQCLFCDHIGIQFEGRSERLPCGCAGPDSQKMRIPHSARLVAAYTAARSARFEAKT